MTRPAALSDASSGQRQPPASGDRFAAFGCEHSPASSGSVAIAEIVAHTACIKRPRGPALASCQRPRPPLAPRRPHRRRASARHPITTRFVAREGQCGGTMKTWLTVAESAEYAGESRDTIYTACERGELHHARISGRRSIRLKGTSARRPAFGSDAVSGIAGI